MSVRYYAPSGVDRWVIEQRAMQLAASDAKVVVEFHNHAKREFEGHVPYRGTEFEPNLIACNERCWVGRPPRARLPWEVAVFMIVKQEQAFRDERAETEAEEMRMRMRAYRDEAGVRSWA